MSAPLLSVASPVWVWLLPLLRTAMELERAVDRAHVPPLRLHILDAAELRAFGVLACRARGAN